MLVAMLSRQTLSNWVIENNGNESKAKEFLKGFSGFLQTDRCEGYNKVENLSYKVIKWDFSI